jgi:tetratricopeptide (TPR) repeat protein
VKDFFVSYSSPDKLWAEWITWQFEHAGYSVLLQPWQFESGPDFIQHMLDATSETRQMIAVLSPDYLDELETHTTWTQVFRQDPTGTEGTLTLLPVKVRACQDRLKGALSLLSYIDLVGRDEDEARDVLLAGVQILRSKSSALLDHPGYREHVVLEQPAFPVSFPRIWNVPPRNRFFTDREEILAQLHTAFKSKTMGVHILSQAISGLGGIGKTQLAIEYAYRYRDEYQAVLWLFAESRDMLVQGCYNLVRALDLPQKDVQDQEEIIGAVREWLQDHVDWLLILDNADDTSLVRAFLPSGASGHVLMTTRAQAVGRIAQGIFVEKMTPEEGALFLLRRAGLLGQEELLKAEDIQWQDAIRIAEVMDGLPLALDQAGSYIEETECRLAGYLSLYKKHRKRLLERRGEPIFDHPKPVATTWNLSFEQVQRDNPAAADLLRLCAFLAADDIPEELVIQGTADVSSPLNVLADDPLAINEVIAELRCYSLLRRDSQNKTLSIHRLVQAVLRDMLSEEERRIWAECAARAVNAVFPEVKFETWAQCQRYLPHVRVCIASITQWHMVFPEVASLHHRAGLYLQERAQYTDAEQLFQEALTIYEQVVEAENVSIVRVLNDLANLSVTMGKYPEAEQYYLRSMAIIEHSRGVEHADLIDTLNKLAELYIRQGRYYNASTMAQRALALAEQVLEAEHPDIATSLANLAEAYRELAEYRRAEAFSQRALAIREKVLGSTHHSTGSSLNSLALLYHGQGKYEKAEPLLLRAQAIAEELLGPMHPDTATSLNNLALLYKAQGRYEEAEPLYRQTLSIREQVLGAMHPGTATSLNNLASLYQDQGKYEEAEVLYQRALAIDEQVLGVMHPGTATSLNNLALLYQDQGKYADAEPLYRQTLSIREQVLGVMHPATATSLNNLASLYQDQGKYADAEPLYQRALAIDEQILGSEHPDTATDLNNLALLYQDQGKYADAEPLYQRALAIDERVLGSEHPGTATDLNNLASLYHAQGKYADAEPLYRRALVIDEQVLGLEHPNTVRVRNTLSNLLHKAKSERKDDGRELTRE